MSLGLLEHSACDVKTDSEDFISYSSNPSTSISTRQPVSKGDSDKKLQSYQILARYIILVVSVLGILKVILIYLYYADLQTKDVPVGIIARIVVSVSLLVVVLLSMVAFIVHCWRTKIGAKTSCHQSKGK